MAEDRQPIETAPRDGTWLRLYGGKIDWDWVPDDDPAYTAKHEPPPYVIAHWVDCNTQRGPGWGYCAWEGGMRSWVNEPTHWAPA